MTKDLSQLFAALFAGQQLAIVHLSMLLSQHANIDKQDIAESFRKVAELIPSSADNREILIMVVNQIAAGVDSAGDTFQKEMEEQLKTLLH
ncbi:MAG: hypothetical protein ACRC5A_03390 [Enterobacteriaceae bacterium]